MECDETKDDKGNKCNECIPCVNETNAMTAPIKDNNFILIRNYYNDPCLAVTKKGVKGALIINGFS